MPFSYLLRLARKLVVKRLTETFLSSSILLAKKVSKAEGQKISISDRLADLPFCFAFIFMLWRQIELN